MGLGKTVQMIALICASLELGEEDDYDPKPTLLVIPKSLLPMWMEQMKIWANKLSITRYYGSHRKKSVDQRLFARTDITVTTYGEVRSEYKDYKAVNLAFQAQANHDGDLVLCPSFRWRILGEGLLPLMARLWSPPEVSIQAFAISVIEAGVLFQIKKNRMFARRDQGSWTSQFWTSKDRVG